MSADIISGGIYETSETVYQKEIREKDPHLSDADFHYTGAGAGHYILFPVSYTHLDVYKRQGGQEAI